MAELFKAWLESFEVHWKDKNPYWDGAGYDGFLKSNREYHTVDYALREKHLANDVENIHETFYITGHDLKAAFTAGYEAGKKAK